MEESRHFKELNDYLIQNYSDKEHKNQNEDAAAAAAAAISIRLEKIEIITNEADEDTANNSFCSTVSYDNELNLSLALEQEVENITQGCDELPAFEIRQISPISRTPSPIDNEESDYGTPLAELNEEEDEEHLNQSRKNPHYVALHDINAQISPLRADDALCATNNTSLETIYEHVLLTTPPRQTLQAVRACSSTPRSAACRRFLHRPRNLLELAATQNLRDKENLNPAGFPVSPKSA